MFVLAFYILWTVVIAILKNRQICKFRKLRRFAEKVYKSRIRFNIINECMWLCWISFVFFGLWQLYDTSFSYDWSIASFVVALICVLLCLIVMIWVVYLSLKFRDQVDQVPQQYKFIFGDDSFLPYQIPLRYLRKFLLCCFLFSALAELQIIAIMAANIMVLSFYFIYKPSKSKFSNWVNILI